MPSRWKLSSRAVKSNRNQIHFVMNLNVFAQIESKRIKIESNYVHIFDMIWYVRSERQSTWTVTVKIKIKKKIQSRMANDCAFLVDNPLRKVDNFPISSFFIWLLCIKSKRFWIKLILYQNKTKLKASCYFWIKNRIDSEAIPFDSPVQ